MRVVPANEPDSSWEDHEPRFRVYLFAGSGAFTVTTVDILDADVLEVIRWAQLQAGGDAMYAVALVGETRLDAPPSRGLTWLVGMDANDRPSSPKEEQTLARMRTRQGVIVVLDDEPVDLA